MYHCCSRGRKDQVPIEVFPYFHLVAIFSILPVYNLCAFNCIASGFSKNLNAIEESGDDIFFLGGAQ